jgi:primosomal protein N'
LDNKKQKIKEKQKNYLTCLICGCNEWIKYKCTNCGADIDNAYIGNKYIYDQLLNIVTGNEKN